MSNTPSVQPHYEHDCDCCKFYGNHFYSGKLFDLYWCPQHDTYIARFGTEGDYISASKDIAEVYKVGHPICQVIALKTYYEELENQAILEQAKERENNRRFKDSIMNDTSF